MKIKNYYQILGIDPFATQSEIKRAYLARLKEYHPDKKMGHNTFAYKRFQAVMEAYEAIKTPEKRAHYDNLLMVEISTQKEKDRRKAALNAKNDNRERIPKPNFWTWFNKREKDRIEKK